MSDKNTATGDATTRDTSKARRIVLVMTTILSVAVLVAIMLLMHGEDGAIDLTILHASIRSFGVWAPAFFILIQALHVLFPVVQAPLLRLTGAMLFGPWWGFVYNFLGAFIGCLAAYWLARDNGRILIRKTVGEALYERFERWSGKAGARRALFWSAMVFPFLPNAFYCYYLGFRGLRLERTLPSIALGLVPSMVLYSVAPLILIDLI